MQLLLDIMYLSSDVRKPDIIVMISHPKICAGSLVFGVIIACFCQPVNGLVQYQDCMRELGTSLLVSIFLRAQLLNSSMKLIAKIMDARLPISSEEGSC